MNQRSLRDEIRDHYQGQEPSPEALARLVAMTDAVEQRPRRRGLATAMLAAAAAVLLAFTLSFLWPMLGVGADADHQLAGAVAKEIAMNHSKGLAVEFPTSSFAELRRRMDKLDFELVEAGRLESRGLRLLGGRYCSIQGHLAAQLRLKTPAGDVVTLYQTPLVAELAALPTGELQAHKLRIELWREEGVFFGLARLP